MQEDKELTTLPGDVPAEAVAAEDRGEPAESEGGADSREQQQLVAEAAVNEDPDAPVVVEGADAQRPEVTESGAEGVGATQPEASYSRGQQVIAEAAVNEDPDAPVMVEGSDGQPPEVTESGAEPAGETQPEASEAASDSRGQQVMAEAAVTEDPDAPAMVEDSNAQSSEVAESPEEDASDSRDQQQVIAGAAVTEDPDAPVMVEAPEASASELQPAEGESQPKEEIPAEQLLMTEEQPSADQTEAERLAVLEAIVYVTDEPLSLQQIAKALGQPESDVKTLLDRLVEEYNQPWHGLTIKEVAGGYKMATKPEYHEAVRAVVKNLNPPLKLSLAALETLAVIAYKQPITAPEIMEIRGVQGAGVLKTLIDRKLITTAGRKNVVGKPILYKTTREFLVQFGLRDLNELPTLKEFEDLRRMAFSDQDPEPEAVSPETTSEEEATTQQPVE